MCIRDRLRATLYSLVVSQPHKATFTILKRMLQKAMEVLTREKTVPMIVRQLKTVCNADQILVLDRRKIVQGGTHDTLVTQRGISVSYTHLDVYKRQRQHRWHIAT